MSAKFHHPTVLNPDFQFESNNFPDASKITTTIANSILISELKVCYLYKAVGEGVEPSRGS